MGNIKNYYAGSNSSRGFYSLFDEALKGLDHLYILKGGPGTGKSTLVRKVGDSFNQKGFDIEWIHCSSDNHSLDGVIIPDLKTGIVDGTAPHIIEPKYPGVRERIVNLGDFRDDKKLSAHKETIINLTDKISAAFTTAYEKFATAKNAHDVLEKVYIKAMDFKKADLITEKLMDRIFMGDIHPEQQAGARHLFMGAATPNGAVNFYDNLTEANTTRFILKGRAGSGKSTMMKKIGAHAETLGLHVDYYHCAFDPVSVDLVSIPALKSCILDGTDPHVVDPSRTGDEIVDMFELCIDQDVEVREKETIAKVHTEYKDNMKLGTKYLAEAKRLHDELESYYLEVMDFDAINDKTMELIHEIEAK